MKVMVSAIALAIFPQLALACAPGDEARLMTSLSSGGAEAYVAMSPPAISAPFDMTLVFCGEDAAAIERVEVAAVMPAHRHGMNYEPSVTEIGDGRFAVSGMVFHMPGAWRLDVSAISANGPAHFELDVTLK